MRIDVGFVLSLALAIALGIVVGGFILRHW